MLVIGLTGGIGSGKTVASDYLADKGITVVDADVVAREVVAPGEPALNAIVERFGADVLNGDGSLDRAALRRIVFADENARRDLEAITHPAIRDRIMEQLHASGSPYTLLVSPLLLETDQYELVDRVLVIDAPEALQRERTVARDAVPPEQVDAIMAAQMNRVKRRGRADDIVVNDGNREHLYVLLDKMHQRYLKLAKAQAPEAP